MWPRITSPVSRDETLQQDQGLGHGMGVGAELVREDLEISIVISVIHIIM